MQLIYSNTHFSSHETVPLSFKNSFDFCVIRRNINLTCGKCYRIAKTFSLHSIVDEKNICSDDINVCQIFARICCRQDDEVGAGLRLDMQVINLNSLCKFQAKMGAPHDMFAIFLMSGVMRRGFTNSQMIVLKGTVV